MKQHSPGFLRVVEDAKSRVKEIDAAAAAERVRSGAALLLDVREDHEWQAAHAAGAKHLGRGILERDIEKQVPDIKQPIICYCGGGYRSALAADTLQKMGYHNVLSLAGGWSAWQAEGLPQEAGLGPDISH